MNYFRHSQNRRRRKLPHVQRRQQESSIFWPSFHGALAWMRKNQETIDTAVRLLEIYPSLIQDRSLDVLWEFLHPFFVTKASTSVSKNQTSTKTDLTQRSASIPTICVTQCEDDYNENVYGMPTTASNLVKVSIVGDGGSAYFSRLVNDVRVFALTAAAPVHESDVCIFLMNSENIANKACYRDLVLASTLDIPILFIKPSGFTLPSPLPDAVIQFALCSSSNASRYRKTNCGGSARANKSNQHQTQPRSGSSLQHTDNTTKRPFVRHDSDLIVLLIDGYRKSIEYDLNNHDASVKTLKENIEKVTKMSLSSVKEAVGNLFLETAETASTSGNFLSVPDPDADIFWMDSSDTELDEDMMSETVDSPDLAFEGRSISELSEVESETSSLGKETFYFVSNKKYSSGKVVKWPPASTEILSTTSSTSDTPVNFYNLDFENFQTDMDLFDSDSTSDIT